jgi:hypothetical protein
MRERRRKHDDVHFPMAKGARGWRGGVSRNGAVLVIPEPAATCEACGCGFRVDTNAHEIYCSTAIKGTTP